MAWICARVNDSHELNAGEREVARYVGHGLVED